MNDDDLRALIREAVARHVGGSPPSSPVRLAGPAAAPGPQPFSLDPGALASHPSHYQYLALVNVGEACVIEPTVTCNHCGYCRSHGH